MIKFLETLTHTFANIEIAAFPLSISLLIAIICYETNKGIKGLIIAITVAIIGLVIGILLAIKINKKGKSLETISRISASPELDNLEEENN